jgi:hypothetical protein
MTSYIDIRKCIPIIFSITMQRPIASDEHLYQALNDEVHLRSILRTAMNNRVLYTFVANLLETGIADRYRIDPRSLRLLELIYVKGRSIHTKMAKTLDLLARSRSQIILIKTFPSIEINALTFDIDIMTIKKKDLWSLLDYLKIYYSPIMIEGGIELRPRKRDLLPIDIYHDFTHNGVRVIDPENMCINTKEHMFEDTIFKTPDTSGETLLLFSQIVFQNRFITINDILRFILLSNKKDIDLGKILWEVERFNWSRAFFDAFTRIIYLYEGLLRNSYKVRLPYFLHSASLLVPNRATSCINNLFIDSVNKLRFYLFKKIPIYSDWIAI